MSNFGKGIDKKIFWPATIVTLALGVVFFAFPEESNTVLNQIHAFTTNQLGWFFLLAVTGLLILCLYFAFSRLGDVVLGAPGEKPAYSTFTWLGMILTSGTGGSLLYLGAVEWIWMSDAPPFGVAPRSAEALSWASAFGMWNWGFSAWAFYVACAVPIGYFFFVKRKNNMKMSEYCRPPAGQACRRPGGPRHQLCLPVRAAGRRVHLPGAGHPAHFQRHRLPVGLGRDQRGH